MGRYRHAVSALKEQAKLELQNIYEVQLANAICGMEHDHEKYADKRSVLQISDEDFSDLDPRGFAGRDTFSLQPGSQEIWMIQFKIWLRLAVVHIAIELQNKAINCIQEASLINLVSQQVKYKPFAKKIGKVKAKEAIVRSIFKQLAREAAQMAYYTSQKTRSSRVIQSTVRLLLPGELAKHAVSEGTKAVRFTIHGKQTALFRATIFSRKNSIQRFACRVPHEHPHEIFVVHTPLNCRWSNMLRRANELEPHTGRELEEDEGEMTEPPRPPMTGAERMRRHRKRKKEQEEEVRDVTAAERMRNYRQRKKLNQRETEPNDTPAALNLEPMPGGSRDPVRFFPRPDPNQLQLSPRGAMAPVDSVMPHGGKPNCKKADQAFRKKFTENELGAVCNICERIWFQDDLKPITTDGARVLLQPGHFESVAGFMGCQTCRNSLRDGRVPVLSITNGFTYPELPTDMPHLDIITERLISARLPFMQIRRLCHARGSYSILGQVINVPVDVNEMVRSLPRQLDDDYAFNVCIKKHLIHKSNYLRGFVKKSVVKAWLRFLIDTPLYKREGIVIDERFLESYATDGIEGEELIELEVAETVDAPRDVPSVPQRDDQVQLDVVDNEGELFGRQQQTVAWNEDMCLNIAPAQNRTPTSIVYDEYAEEMSFPGIYLGKPRKFREGVRVTPYHKATSETRRRDRRGAKPAHILYMGVKIMRLRAHEGMTNYFRVQGTRNMTRAQLSDKEHVDSLIKNHMAWMSGLPNSAMYWQIKQKDLFAMVRQLGKPTVFLTMSANEIQWPGLLKALYKLAEKQDRTDLTDPLNELSALERTVLASEDPVTCCLYANKLFSVIMQILQSKTHSPFGKYYVTDYFKRIEFQHRGSPHVHAVLWLANDPKETVSEQMPGTLDIINTITSIRIEDLPEQTANKQVHKCTFTCTKRGEKRCRFNIPYWPMREQRILLPLRADDSRHRELKKRAEEMRDILETMVFDTIEDFLAHCECTYAYYLDVVRASLKLPTVFYKRSMDELRTNPFNGWIADKLRSNMDLQFIIDVQKLCHYLVEYVNKSNRGLSGLHRELIIMQEQNPELDYGELMKKISLKMLGTVEMCVQEAAWFLLRIPMSEASRKVEYVPTVWPQDRSRSRKSYKTMDEEGIGEDSTDIWSQNCIEKYEERDGMADVCLADFVACYTQEGRSNRYRKRGQPRVLRWRNYQMSELSEYKRVSVLLFVPFRNELVDILDQNKFLQLYDLHEEAILAKRKEYDCELNVEQTVEEYERTLANLEDGEQNNPANEKHDELVRTVIMQPNNDDFELLPTRTLRSVIKQRPNVMSKEDYCAMMRATNREQRALILHTIHLLTCFEDHEPLQVFLTGPAGSGKTFTLRALMETLNRYSQEHNSRDNAYVASASTGKAASAIGGTTLHHAYHITMSRQVTKMSFETLQVYRTEMQRVKAHIIDEISMVGAHILNITHLRLQDVYMNYLLAFGGVDLYLCGDLRQLFPVMAKPVFKPPANSISGAVLWQLLKYHELKQVMRQADKEFSDILTKIGNGDKLTADETKVIESRFFTAERLRQEQTEGAVRLFHRNLDVTRYNSEALDSVEGVTCTADDTFVGYKSVEQLANARVKLYKMCLTETAGLQYTIKLCPGKPYMVTTNVDVEDGIVNGAIGDLKYVEESFDDDAGERITRIWVKFDNEQIGVIARKKAEPMTRSRADILQLDWTPIVKRSANIDLGSRIKCKRIQFPVVPACALTIHKSQGGTFDKIVFEYDKGQEQQMVYVALSRVKSLQGLFMTNSKGDFKFHHAKGCNSPKMKDLRNELKRLENHRLQTIVDEVSEVIESSEPTTTLMSINVQSLRAHQMDINTDPVLPRVHLLALSETWMDDNASIELEGFTRIVQSKRTGVRAGGVAIYQNTTAPNTTPATPYTLEVVGAERSQEFSEAAKYGDICAAKVMVMGAELLLVSVYISPGTTTKQKLWFLSRHLGPIAELDTPMVVTGDFNLDVSKQDSSRFVEFMANHFELRLSNDVKKTTTLGGTVLDLTFVKNTAVEVTRYTSYFSYHRPMLSVVRPIVSSTPQSN
ncbi:tetratricopeptide repeat protein, tpr [Culex quinquefasciatus]|uniref:ATP-dependent DNA helicase n=1 Tax=Culex quinquefasciatus TaxID=7176 RepID=B0WQS5_CULQU|nr:tetratricopeptide repeat protein, tpr [Culex quinquefasciatus]|eukprot:XP_001851059.1 tetratricopeptide repeat protein, tpr [Culex quinquefasciatus]